MTQDFGRLVHTFEHTRDPESGTPAPWTFRNSRSRVPRLVTLDRRGTVLRPYVPAPLSVRLSTLPSDFRVRQSVGVAVGPSTRPCRIPKREVGSRRPRPRSSFRVRPPTVSIVPARLRRVRHRTDGRWCEGTVCFTVLVGTSRL